MMQLSDNNLLAQTPPALQQSTWREGASFSRLLAWQQSYKWSYKG